MAKQILVTFVPLTEPEKEHIIQKYVPLANRQHTKKHIPHNSHNAEDEDFWGNYNDFTSEIPVQTAYPYSSVSDDHSYYPQNYYPQNNYPQNNYPPNNFIQPDVSVRKKKKGSPAVIILSVLIMTVIGLTAFLILDKSSVTDNILPASPTSSTDNTEIPPTDIPTQPATIAPPPAVNGTVLRSQKDGDITFALYDDGTLLIEGSGTIPDNFAQNHTLTDKISSVIIHNGVTAIGNSAFYECNNMTDIYIPDSIVKIGDSAISLCGTLKSVAVPASVSSLGNHPFYWCKELTEIIVSSENPFYCSQDGVLFDKKQTTLLCYPTGKSGDYIIPSTVTDIENLAFYGCGNSSVTISENLQNLGFGAFLNCKNLTQIKVSDKNNFFCSVNGVLFSKDKTKIVCYPTGISGSYTIPDGVTTIGMTAFEWQKKLSSVTIPDSVTTIENYAFQGCAVLTEVTIPDHVVSIGDSAFSGCSELKAVFLPDSVTAFGTDVFKSCQKLTLYGSDNSYAKKYAESNNIPFTVQ